MTGEAVALIVQKRARMAGLDPAGFSAHSLRAGLATSAAAAGLEERNIQRQTRHRSTTVLRGYIREGAVFRQNVSGHVGL
jgi:integrase